MIEEIIEKTKNANEEVRKEAVKSLGKLKELTNKELGIVVMALLDLFKDKTLRNNGAKWVYDMCNAPGDSLYELSKTWDLGKSIPKDKRKQVIEQIIKFDSKNWFFYVEWEDVGHTAYDGYDILKAVPLLPKFRSLFSSHLEVEYLLELTHSPNNKIRLSAIRELKAIKKNIRKETRKKIGSRLLELTRTRTRNIFQEALEGLSSLGEVIPEDQREEVIEHFLNLLKDEKYITRENALNLGCFGSIIPVSQRKEVIKRLLEIYRETCYTYKGGRHPELGAKYHYTSCLSNLTDIIPNELQELVVRTLLEFTNDENNDIICAAILDLETLVVNKMVPDEYLETIKTRFDQLRKQPKEYGNSNVRWFADNAFYRFEYLED